MAAGGEDVVVGIAGDARSLTSAINEARLGIRGLAQEIQQLNTVMANAGRQAGTGTGGSGGLSPFGIWNVQAAALIQNLRNVRDIAGEVFGVVSKMSGLSLAAGFAKQVMVDPFMQMAGEARQSFQPWQLSVDTEKAMGVWKFLYGKGGQTGAPADDPTVKRLMQWTSQFSFQIPYQRQDLHGAITALGRTGMSAADIMKFMPTVADIGTLNPDRNLQQAAWAIQGAMHGYTRMLRYDYGIDPRELEKYGLKIHGLGTLENPQQLLPALERYVQARGLKGSAKYASTHTWWGEWSSFIDRIQNFAGRVGGTQLSGQITPGSMFADMKKNLGDLTSWMDDPKNQAVVTTWANLLEHTFGGAVGVATTAIGGLLKGIQDSGAITTLQGLLNDLNSASVRINVSGAGQAVGTAAGGVVSTAATGLEGFLTGLGNSELGKTLLGDVKNLGDWLSDPEHQQQVKDFFTHFGETAGTAITNVANTVTNLITTIDGIKTAVSGAGQALQDFGNTPVGQALGWLIDKPAAIGRAGGLGPVLLGVLGERFRTDPMLMSHDALVTAASRNPFLPGTSVDQAQTSENAELQLLIRQFGFNVDKINEAFNHWLTGMADSAAIIAGLKHELHGDESGRYHPTTHVRGLPKPHAVVAAHHTAAWYAYQAHLRVGTGVYRYGEAQAQAHTPPPTQQHLTPLQQWMAGKMGQTGGPISEAAQGLSEHAGHKSGQSFTSGFQSAILAPKSGIFDIIGRALAAVAANAGNSGTQLGQAMNTAMTKVAEKVATKIVHDALTAHDTNANNAGRRPGGARLGGILGS
jgi:hypothetical protein